METKANYTLVGAFVVCFFLGITTFVVWLSKAGWYAHETLYEIYFTGSVTGIKEGSTVRYRGIPVGNVKTIEINPNNVEQIRTLISVDNKVSIKKDAFASIEIQGLAGGTYIQINGGSKDAPRLEEEGNHRYPVIASRYSHLEEVVDTVPDLIRKVSQLVVDMRELFSHDVTQNFQKILTNIRDLTDQLNHSESGVGKTLQETAKTLQASLKQLDNVTTDIHAILHDNRQPLRDFSSQGLSNFNRFLIEGSESFSSLRRLVESIERSPTRFIHNDPKEGYRP